MVKIVYKSPLIKVDAIGNKTFHQYIDDLSYKIQELYKEFIQEQRPNAVDRAIIADKIKAHLDIVNFSERY